MGRDGLLGHLGHSLWQAVADPRATAEDTLALVGRGPIDREPAIVAVHHLNHRVGAIDNVGKQPAFGERSGDARLQRAVDPLKRTLGLATRGDVLEQHRNQPALERPDAERRQFEQPAGRNQFLLEPDRLARLQYRAIACDPGVGFVGHHLAQTPADDVGDARVGGVGGVRFDMDVVA